MLMNKKPSFYGMLYFINIILFSIIYFFVFDDSFNNTLSYPASLYFSVVTATTLGFGDIIPSLEKDSLLLTISFEVVLGVIIIGLFLNSISQKLSDQKDQQAKIESEQEKDKWMSQAMGMLRPVIEIELRTLSQYYKFTSIEEKIRYKQIPEVQFTDEYYKQIVDINYFARFEYSNGSEFMFLYFNRENDKFKEKLEKFLYKYAHAIPMETLVRLNKIQEHKFLEFPNMAKMTHVMVSEKKRVPVWPQDYPMDSEGMTEFKISTCKDFHILLLEAIKEINFYFVGNPILINIELSNNILPRVGCARQKS
ncbi:two pore domain potassium channel family protein [Salmonella enterica]|nr:two pore domain potassium channel family protein [Salmonella enterica]EBF5002783.1 two pore domain potassium channel family protein [Salmonella enterica]EBI4207090.1 two pore domain potassium channel family protein [Salmonella enterica]